MKKIISIFLLIIILCISCDPYLFTPKGRWNPNDPQYDEETDPDSEDKEVR